MPEFLPARVIEGMSELSESLASGDADPVSGPIAALVAAWAASLAAAAAHRSRDGWDEAAGARAQAQALRRRAIRLAECDLDAYAAAKAALAEPRQPNDSPGPRDEGRDWRLGQAVRQAADPPFGLSECALDIAELARTITAHAADEVRADAAVAAMLASAVARAAAHLVEINLVGGSDQQLLLRARGNAEAAEAAATAAAGVD